jgi:hypothetical protein
MVMTATMHVVASPHETLSSGECVMITGLAGPHHHHAEAIVAGMSTDLRVTGTIMMAVNAEEVAHGLPHMLEGIAAGIGRGA